MYAISAEHITKEYRNHRALDDVTVQVPKGSIFGLLGPNGAGKTSLIRIINQITAPDRGEVKFFGEPLEPKHVMDIGYLPEERGLYRKMKVGEQCLYLAQLKGMNKREAIASLKAWFERFDMQAWWEKKVEELSKGMAQKVQFITTVVHNPRLLILDEPFSGFDPINATLIKKEILKLRDQGTTVILSTHNMGSVEEVCSHIALINESRKVLGGEVAQVRNEYKENVYELEFEGDMIAFTNALWTGYELLDHEQENGIVNAKVKFVGDYTVNQLLETVIPHVQIRSVNEVIPSMNEVFIKAVERKEQEA